MRLDRAGGASGALLPDVPIVAGSAMHQPATAALLEPAELKGVCAETAASPISATSGPMKVFLDACRPLTGSPTPAAAQFDAVGMRQGDRRSPQGQPTRHQKAMRDRLASESYTGVVTTT
jgi:branched-chain amino acid transport system substrate-binding protein